MMENLDKVNFVISDQLEPFFIQTLKNGLSILYINDQNWKAEQFDRHPIIYVLWSKIER
jgi:hypothetical protein